MLSLAWSLFINTCLYLTVKCSTEMEWIDPFKLESTPPKQSACVAVASDSDVFAYYRRTVNLILSSVIVETSDSNTYKGRLFVDISREDYEFLKRFATIRLEEPLSLQKADQILTKVFTKSTLDELSDVLIYWSDYIYLTFFNRVTGIYLTILAVLIVIYRLLKASYTLSQVITYLLCLGYMLDFVFTWKRMLQELEINKYADSLKYEELPADCRLSDMSGWKFILSFISGASKCREYHKIIFYDVFWDVGPLDVFAHQSRVFLGIASNVGIGLSKLTSGLMSELPFPLNVILLPILLIFVLFLVWTTFTFLTGTHVDLNLCHLIYIKFKTNKAIKKKPEKRREGNREELQDIHVRIIDDKKRKESKRKIRPKHEALEKSLEIEQGNLVENIATS